MCPSAGWAGSAPSWSGRRASAGAELRTDSGGGRDQPRRRCRDRRRPRGAPARTPRAERRRTQPFSSACSKRRRRRGRRESPEGAQVKVNMLLRRLPRLRDERVAPEAAFAGTFHINETMSQLDDAYAVAAGGGIPNPLPAEIYCHSLTDPSILGARAAGRRRPDAHPLRTAGAASARRRSRIGMPRARRCSRPPTRSLDSVLAEPIADCVYEAPDGSPCVEARTTADLEESLGHDRRRHLPRAAVVAVGRGRGPARLPRGALGRRDRAPARAAVRFGGAARRRRERHRRPQRGDGRAGAARAERGAPATVAAAAGAAAGSPRSRCAQWGVLGGCSCHCGAGAAMGATGAIAWETCDG